MLAGSMLTLPRQRLASPGTAVEEGRHVVAAVFRRGPPLPPVVLGVVHRGHTELGIQDDETSKDDT